MQVVWLRPQINVALALQLGDEHHAALVGDREARQQILERDVLATHRVDAGIELDVRLHQRGEFARGLGTGGGGMERPQRRAVHHKRDRHLLGPTGAFEVMIDVAQHEAGLVEVAQMIDRLGARVALRARGFFAGRDQRARRGERRRQDVASVHGRLPSIDARRRGYQSRRNAASSSPSRASGAQISLLTRSSRKTRSSAPPRSSIWALSSSGLSARQIAISSSLTIRDLSSAASPIAMPPPPQSPPQLMRMPSRLIFDTSAWPQSPLETKSPLWWRSLTPSRNE